MASNARDEHAGLQVAHDARSRRLRRHDLRTSPTVVTDGRRSQGPFCDGNDGPATIKLWSAPLTLRAGLAKGYGQFTITNDGVRSTAESTYTRPSLPLAA